VSVAVFYLSITLVVLCASQQLINARPS